MDSLGSILVAIGLLAIVIGVFGFVDTRKVDRRYKTGYKHNEPDTRNFPRAGRRVLWGVGFCIVGAAVNNLTGSHGAPVQPNTVQVAGAPERKDEGETISQSMEAVRQVSDSEQERPFKGTPSVNERVVTSSAPPQTETLRAHMDSGRQTFTTSFDCVRASSSVELLICADPGLAAMDVELGQMYRAALTSIQDPSALKRSQLDWLSSRDACGNDLNCLRRKYGERIGQFNGSIGAAPLTVVGPETEKP
ncbi:lysozyme inhibitor LprI family protein [Pandoraea sp. PE-S2R-1]|uniref:lysozyme inhibitor LprI family protein n=1 Tax=Pandoraea sp. PE-S2R-1 TaxID=1986994 RepID=UPI00201649A0|nr:lysozyme inhibitor LprI family protein [Pandoraea sp. PE-S2R-1]